MRLLQVETKEQPSPPVMRTFQITNNGMCAINQSSVPKDVITLASKLTKCPLHKLEHFYKLVEVVASSHRAELAGGSRVSPSSLLHSEELRLTFPEGQGEVPLWGGAASRASKAQWCWR